MEVVGRGGNILQVVSEQSSGCCNRLQVVSEQSSGCCNRLQVVSEQACRDGSGRPEQDVVEDFRFLLQSSGRRRNGGGGGSEAPDLK